MLKTCYDGLAHLRLKVARISRGYNNRTLFAQKSNTPPTTYRSLELGEYELKVSDAVKFSNLLNVSLNWLITGRGSPLEHIDNSDPNDNVLFYKHMRIELERLEFEKKCKDIK